MNAYHFSPQELETLSDINTKFDQVKTKETLSLVKNNADDYWRFLQSCETYCTQKTFTTLGYTHDMENMLSLYIINDLIDQGYLTQTIRDFGLPKSEIITTDIEEGILDGYVAEDGTLYVLSKFCQLDPMWSAVLVYYAYYKYFPKKVHPFITEPSKITTHSTSNKTHSKQDNTIKIAILGDWGTGIWKDGHQDKCPAELVIDGIASLNPDYVIHLGDVYYAGTSNEERKHLLGLLKGKLTGELYTMNSNHEMYDGANGLYDIALKSDDFTAQHGRTYFSIDLGNWVLVGLDSAYFDDSFLYMDGSLCKDKAMNEQIEFLQGIAAQNKPILLMTHHNGIGIKDHKFTINNKLWKQVTEALGTYKDATLIPHSPDVWYWGHVHNGLVYNTEALIKASGLSIPNTALGKAPLFRCSGHASMPFGNGTGFFTEDPITKKQTMRKELEYYAHTPMAPGKHKLTDAQEKRVLNGFSMLEISKTNTLTETFYEVSNTYAEPKVVWRN